MTSGRRFTAQEEAILRSASRNGANIVSNRVEAAADIAAGRDHHPVYSLGSMRAAYHGHLRYVKLPRLFRMFAGNTAADPLPDRPADRPTVRPAGSPMRAATR